MVSATVTRSRRVLLRLASPRLSTLSDRLFRQTIHRLHRAHPLSFLRIATFHGLITRRGSDSWRVQTVDHRLSFREKSRERSIEPLLLSRDLFLLPS